MFGKISRSASWAEKGRVPRTWLKRAGYTHEELSNWAKNRLRGSGERPQNQDGGRSGKGEMQNRRREPRGCADGMDGFYIYVFLDGCVHRVLVECGVRGQLQEVSSLLTWLLWLELRLLALSPPPPPPFVGQLGTGLKVSVFKLALFLPQFLKP